MSRILVIANQKGGVGKTTTAINMGASLAVAEQRILLVDTDPQGNTTSGLGVDRDELQANLYDFYASGTPLEEIITSTSIQGLDIVPSTVDLIGAEIELMGREGRETMLRDALQTIRDWYDFVVIDCPPSLGLLTLNALVAAERIIVPVQCEYYALEGLGLLMNTIELVKGSYNPALEIEGIVLTMFDTRNNLAKQVAEEVRAHFGDKVYRTTIPRNVSLSEAPSHGKPAMFYDARSKGAQSYISLAREVLGVG